MDKIFFKKLVDAAKLPTRGSLGAVGYDLFSIEEVRLMPKKRASISIGLAVNIPNGYYGRIAPRSGLAHKNGLDVLAGVIDPDYRGEIKVILYNSGDEDVLIQEGDRIAQFIFEQCGVFDIEEVAELDDTARGLGGLGSTGK